MGGGVACNGALRARLERDAVRLGLPLYMPEPRHCADNAAMVAALGFFQWQRGERAPDDLAAVPTGKAGPRSTSANSGR
jgi:N6-L-threonylcarbamoyladenine synthase